MTTVPAPHYPDMLLIDMGDAATQLVKAYQQEPYYTHSAIRDETSPLNIAIDECIEQCVDTLTTAVEAEEHLAYLLEVHLEKAEVDLKREPVPATTQAAYDFGRALNSQVKALHAYPADGRPFPYYYSGRIGTKILMQYQGEVRNDAGL